LNPEALTFGERLADASLARDWSGVHALLAPWLQSRLTIDDVREFFERDYLRMMSFAGIAELHYPATHYVSGNNSTLQDLREKKSWLARPRPIAAEVTADNFRQWLKIQLRSSPEQAEALDIDLLTEIWLIVVEHGAELRVGYWSHDAYEVAPEGWISAS
jgi:hypothetical protein